MNLNEACRQAIRQAGNLSKFIFNTQIPDWSKPSRSQIKIQQHRTHNKTNKPTNPKSKMRNPMSEVQYTNYKIPKCNIQDANFKIPMVGLLISSSQNMWRMPICDRNMTYFNLKCQYHGTCTTFPTSWCHRNVIGMQNVIRI